MDANNTQYVVGILLLCIHAAFDHTALEGNNTVEQHSKYIATLLLTLGMHVICLPDSGMMYEAKTHLLQLHAVPSGKLLLERSIEEAEPQRVLPKLCAESLQLRSLFRQYPQGVNKWIRNFQQTLHSTGRRYLAVERPKS